MFDTSAITNGIIDKVSASKGTSLGEKMKRKSESKDFEKHLERAMGY